MFKHVVSVRSWGRIGDEAPPVAGAEKRLNAFETLTLAPIDLRLVAPALMSPDEIAWLDAYHARVRETLSPALDPPTRDWLAQATRSVAETFGVPA